MGKGLLAEGEAKLSCGRKEIERQEIMQKAKLPQRLPLSFHHLFKYQEILIILQLR